MKNEYPLTILTDAKVQLSDRATTYDSESTGERSMQKTVNLFNELTGHKVTTEQGWLFMIFLKAVRSVQGDFKEDNYIDGAAYFALAAEEAGSARSGIEVGNVRSGINDASAKE